MLARLLPLALAVAPAVAQRSNPWLPGAGLPGTVANRIAANALALTIGAS